MHISKEELYDALELKNPLFFEFYKERTKVELKSRELLIQVIKNYYKKEGYYDTKVSSKVEGKSLFIIIEEGEPLHIKEIEIESQLNLETILNLNKDDIFKADEFTKSKDAIKLLYAKEYYCNIKLNAKAYVDTQKKSVKLSYKIVRNNPCYFHTIEVNSSKTIDNNIAKSLLYFQEGEPYSFEKIKKSYINIYAYDGISKASIESKIESDSSVNIKLQVEENEKPLHFLAGFGLSSDEGFIGEMGIKDRNFYRNLKSLSLELHLTQVKQRIKSNFNMPLLHKNTTGVEIVLENEKFDGFSEYRLLTTTFLMQRYLPHSFKESIVLDRSSSYDSHDLVIFPHQTLHILSAKLEWNYDVRDDILDPKSGYFINADSMGSIKGSLSDASYLKLNLSAAYIYPLYSSVLAAKISLGTLHKYSGELPVSYKFFAGGLHSNRAYTYRNLGPKNSDGDAVGFDSITENSFEYRSALYKNFRAVIFNDNTFIDRSALNGYRHIYSSGGVGLRYISPIGPIAFDVGADFENPKSQYAFHFHIGELF